MHKIKRKNKGYHMLEIKIPGVYQFHFENMKTKTNKKITFATNKNDEGSKHIEASHISTLLEQMQAATVNFRDVHYHQKMITQKMASHYETAISHNNRIWQMTIVETVFMLVILLVQAIYIKGLMKN